MDRALSKELCKLTETLGDMPEDTRGFVALKLAARLLEFSAFELAEYLDSGSIGDLISIAARLDDEIERNIDTFRTQTDTSLAKIH